MSLDSVKMTNYDNATNRVFFFFLFLLTRCVAVTQALYEKFLQTSGNCGLKQGDHFKMAVASGNQQRLVRHVRPGVNQRAHNFGVAEIPFS